MLKLQSFELQLYLIVAIIIIIIINIFPLKISF